MAENEDAPSELIVEFHRGVSEDAARQAISAAGGTVRRKMRTDSPAEVTLLVYAPEGELAEFEAKLRASGDVLRTERNAGGFHIAG